MVSQKISLGPSKYEKPLFELATQVIKKIGAMKKPVILFCGPISTGGFGNVNENIDYLSSVIQTTEKAGISVFNQIDHERKMDLILKGHSGYDYPLLEFFYKPILESGKIEALLFLPLWETSVGSKWEHDFAKSISIPVFYLDGLFMAEIKSVYEKMRLPH